MKYIKLENKQYPLYMREIKQENPNISFPASVSDESLLELGYAAVQATQPPNYNSLTHKLKEVEPKLVGDVYYEEYEVVPLTQEEFIAAMTAKQKELTDAVQTMLDKQAQDMGYDNIITASTYVTSSVERFKAESIALNTWRDKVWVACYAILDDVLTGKRPIPTEDELLAELPKFSMEVQA